jgi:hypothetical protein
MTRRGDPRPRGQRTESCLPCLDSVGSWISTRPPLPILLVLRIIGLGRRDPGTDLQRKLEKKSYKNPSDDLDRLDARLERRSASQPRSWIVSKQAEECTGMKTIARRHQELQTERRLRAVPSASLAQVSPFLRGRAARVGELSRSQVRTAFPAGTHLFAGPPPERWFVLQFACGPSSQHHT